MCVFGLELQVKAVRQIYVQQIDHFAAGVHRQIIFGFV
jgi:hypothetical protein